MMSLGDTLLSEISQTQRRNNSTARWRLHVEPRNAECVGAERNVAAGRGVEEAAGLAWHGARDRPPQAGDSPREQNQVL